MAKNGYDQTYEDDRKENEETRNLILDPIKKGISMLPSRQQISDAMFNRVDPSVAADALNPVGAIARKASKDVEAPKSYEVEKTKVKGIQDAGEAAGLASSISGKKKGGKVMAKKGGTMRSSASKRADGIAQKGHTKGRFC